MRIGTYQLDCLRLPPAAWAYGFQRATGLAMCFREWSFFVGPFVLQKRIR